MSPSRLVTVTDSLELLRPGAEWLASAGVDVRTVPDGTDTVDALALAEGSPVLIVGLLPLDDAGLRRARAAGVEAIVRAGIGYDNVDAVAAGSHGIAVANVPDYCVDEVADHTLLLLLAASRRLTTIRSLGRRSWQVNADLPDVHRVRGQRLGLVGFGRIARQVTARARGFGYEVVAHDPHVDDVVIAELGARPVGMDELFATSDAVSLHCPLTPENQWLVGADRLASMKPTAVLVNTSRGGLVDLDALDRAVAEGRLAAVGLDVLDGEPAPPLDHPLLQRAEVTVTPHTAWYSLDARRDLALRSAEEALRWLDTGAFRHQVNR